MNATCLRSFLASDPVARPRRAALWGACALALLSGCAGTSGTSPGSAPDAWPLQGVYWRVTALKGQAVGTPASGREASMLLDGQRASGFAGCNQYFSGYELAGGSLRFSRPGATLMACPDLAQEQLLLGALPAVASWRVTGDRMQLLDGQGLALAEFQAGSVRLTCDGGQPPVFVHYDNRDPQRPQAMLSFEGRSYAMHRVVSGSGARYAVEQGRRPDWSLQWHTSGREGVLSEAPLDHARAATDARTIARCTQAP